MAYVIVKTDYSSSRGYALPTQFFGGALHPQRYEQIFMVTSARDVGGSFDIDRVYYEFPRVVLKFQL